MSGGVIGTGSTNWNIFAPTNTAGTASSKTWYVTFNVVETTAGGGTGQPTFDSTVRNATNFTGLVVFNADNTGFQDGTNSLTPITSLSTLQDTGSEQQIVTTMINASATTINGGKITTNSVTADQIAGNSIKASELQISSDAAGTSKLFFNHTVDGSNNVLTNAIEIYDSSSGSVPRIKIGKLS